MKHLYIPLTLSGVAYALETLAEAKYYHGGCQITVYDDYNEAAEEADIQEILNKEEQYIVFCDDIDSPRVKADLIPTLEDYLFDMADMIYDIIEEKPKEVEKKKIEWSFDEEGDTVYITRNCRIGCPDPDKCMTCDVYADAFKEILNEQEKIKMNKE